MKESAEAHQVELVQLLGMSTIGSPGFTGFKQDGKYYCLVELQPGSKAKSYPFPVSL